MLNGRPLTSISCWETPAWTISTYSPGFTPSKTKENASVATPFLSAGAVIHCAAPKSSSGRVTAAGPIHFARQSAGFMTPIVHSAGALHGLSTPAAVQVFTFQKTRWEVARGLPA